MGSESGWRKTSMRWRRQATMKSSATRPGNAARTPAKRYFHSMPASTSIMAVTPARTRAVPVPQRHLRGRHPGVRLAAVGLQLHLSYDWLTRANNLLLVPEGSEGVLAAEDIEVRLPDQIRRGPARSVRGDPAGADREEPAQPVLEVHPLLGSGQQGSHAGELKLALGLALLPPLCGQLDPVHRTPGEIETVAVPLDLRGTV